jgi:hypothetical protein
VVAAEPADGPRLAMPTHVVPSADPLRLLPHLYFEAPYFFITISARLLDVNRSRTYVAMTGVADRIAPKMGRKKWITGIMLHVVQAGFS